MATASAWVHVLTWPSLLVYTLLAYREERQMLKQFGEQYRIYREHVPMFFPTKGRWQQFIEGAQTARET